MSTVLCKTKRFKPSDIKPEKKYYLIPRIDGIRCHCRFNGSNPEFFSKTGNKFYLPHIKIKGTFDRSLILDGVLQVSDLDPIENVLGLIKSIDSKKYTRINFYMYDFFSIDPIHTMYSIPFEKRIEYMYSKFVGTEHFRKYCMYDEVDQKSIEYINNALAEISDEGYTGGIIIREADQPYRVNGHCGVFILTEDSKIQAKILDVRAATGIWKGCAIIDCVITDPNGNDIVFSITPSGTKYTRVKFFQDREKWIGKTISITHNGFTRNKNPRYAKFKIPSE